MIHFGLFIFGAMQINIRQATPADAALLADLSRQTFVETFAADNKPQDMELFMQTQFTRAALVAEASAPDALFFLAYAGGEVAGYLRLQLNESKPAELEIARLYAATAFIGKGIGKALMQHALAHAQHLHKACVWLGVWEKNTRAINFYTAWGFEKVGEHNFCVGNDVQRDWIMQKKLQ